ncbi:ParB/RepB/Spo0J family partition protein [bacterium]|nr:ParB/RepB/Spo0J family partition protein [bacterium]MCI0680295.1 ParB/RepB/Spo0J family partition protein [bacterium]
MNISPFQENAIFWVEVEKITPNPYQPRKEFDEARLIDLADSIKQYGVLQPLVVTRREFEKEDGGLRVQYELIAGERRLRASKIAGLREVPVIIRAVADDARAKLELAIIENLQREDLNPIDRARAFERLVSEFGFKHLEIAKKVGKSREYVSNTLRLLTLPEEAIEALVAGKISEGHTRPILMLKDRGPEQVTLFKEIIYKKLSVREAELIARRIAYDRSRKRDPSLDPEIVSIEEKLSESLGTRVQIHRKSVGGRIMIDYFTVEDLEKILNHINSAHVREPNNMMEQFIARLKDEEHIEENVADAVVPVLEGESEKLLVYPNTTLIERREEERQSDTPREEDGMYYVKNFSI